MSSLAMLDRLEAERQQTLDFIAQTVQGAEDQTRDLSKSEQDTLARSRERITELDAQIAPLREFAELQRSSAQAGATFRTPAADAAAGPRSAAHTERRAYEYATAGEFLADGYRAVVNRDASALARLESEGIVVEGSTIQRAIANETTTEVPGLLPKKVVGELLNDLDASRPFISSVGVRDMSGIPGKTFSRPRITQHVAVGKQAAEKTELLSQQFKVDTLDFSKETFGGTLNVSRQVIDWTAPAIWDALLQDFLDEYAIATDDDAAAAFVASVTAEQELDGATGTTPTVDALIAGMYQGAAKAYGASKRLPDAIWMSLDMWASSGAAIDKIRSTTSGNAAGDTSVGTFAGNFLNIPRFVIPSFPAGTMIIGRRKHFEVYEDRIGFLSAVEPRILGVELAYGGYIAKGNAMPKAFVKLVNKV